MALREPHKDEATSLEDKVDDILDHANIAKDVEYDKAHIKVDDWRSRDISWIEQDLKRSS